MVMTRLRGRLALLAPLLAAVLLTTAACDLFEGDEEDPPPIGTPVPTTPTPPPNDIPANGEDDDDDAAGEPAPATGPDPLNGLIEAETFEVEMFEFEFEPAEITFGAGELIEIIVTNTGTETHTFTVDEMPVDAELTNGLEGAIADDADISLELGADRSGAIRMRALEPGEYEFYCAIPGHADEGMRGTLIVEEGEDVAETDE